MIVQTYILGFLICYGPQHGYRLKQLLFENAADFARIKLPTIYYHLEKMKEKGLVDAYEEREGNKPERMVYAITDAGKKEFTKLLNTMLNKECEFEFEQDAALYFMEFLETDDVIATFRKQKENLERIILHIKSHQADQLQQMKHASVHAGIQKMAELIFSHHLLHYQAELEWLNNVIKTFNDPALHQEPKP